MAGTLLYMAPEQLRGGPQANAPAVDQYALGVVLYQMTTGRHPFLVEDDPHHLQTLERIDRASPTPPRKLRGDIDEALNSIILRMMQKNPADRFPSLGEVLTALSAHQQGQRVPVPLPSAWRRVAVWALAGGLLLALVVGVICWFAQPGVPPVVPPARQAPRDLVGFLDLLRRDLDRLDADDQPFQRYFSLAHLQHDPDLSAEQLQRHGDVLTQLLQTLHLADPVVPQPIDPDRTVFRLDLRKVRWTDEAHRKELHRGDPYALQFPPDNTTRELRNVAADLYRKIGEVDDRLPAFVRVDWFTVTFTDPERAHALLALSTATPAQIAERLQRIAALREQTADVRGLYDRPLDLAAVCRELGVSDSEAVRQAILASPRLADDLGLRPLTERKTIDRATWARCDLGKGSAFGELAAALQMGRLRWVLR